MCRPLVMYIIYIRITAVFMISFTVPYIYITYIAYMCIYLFIRNVLVCILIRTHMLQIHTYIYIYIVYNYICMYMYTFIMSVHYIQCFDLCQLELFSSFVNHSYQKKCLTSFRDGFHCMVFLPVPPRAGLFVCIQHFVNEHVGPEVSCRARHRQHIHES